MILLCLAKNRSKVRNTMYKWGKKESLLLKMCKHSVMNVTNSYHGSIGKYYSFGNRANYRIMEQSSVTQYIHKKFPNQKLNSLSIKRSNMLYKISSLEILILGLKD